MTSTSSSVVTRVAWAVTLLALWGVTPAAHAALGEPEASAGADARELQGSITAIAHTTYRIEEFQLPSGTRVREFAALGGNVFAVAWNGPSMPDLRRLMGRFFAEYAVAAGAQAGGRRQLQIAQSDLVVQSGGHMRAFNGRAYLPGSLPAGFNLGELQ